MPRSCDAWARAPGMANGVARRQDDVHHEAADADRRHADQQSGVDQDIRSQPVFHASGT